MKSVVIFEDNPRDMRELRTLSEYVDDQLVFVTKPEEALAEVSNLFPDVMICPFETSYGTSYDLIEAIAYGFPMTRIILTSNYDNIPPLLECINKYQIFRTVVKPFMNLRDVVEALQDAFQDESGLMIDPMQSNLKDSLLSSDISTYWENHDRRLDWDLMKTYNSIRRGILSMNPETPMQDENFYQELFSIFMSDYILNPKPFPEFRENFLEKISRDNNRRFRIRPISDELLESDSLNDTKLFFTIYFFYIYLKNCITPFEAEVSIQEKDHYLLVRVHVFGFDLVFPEYEANREAAIKIMNAFYDKYALGTGEQDKDLAVLFQENNGIHFPRS